MVHADLHVHTDCSDGELSLSAVPAAARRAGVAVVAVTDHDRVHPDLPAPVVAVSPDGGGDAGGGTGVGDDTDAGGDGTATGGDDSGSAGADGSGGSGDADGTVTLVRGVELRVEAAFGRVDLLGYGVEHTDRLDRVLDRVQRNRVERGRAIVESVEDRLGVDLDVEVREGFGRPHVARAVDRHPAVELDYEGAFAKLIGSDGPCYVAREVPEFETGRSVLAEACGLVSLAHPLRYEDPGAALALCAELDAVEARYHYGRPVDPAPVERAVREHDLLVTGGSDAHDDRLGLAGLDRRRFEPVRDRLPAPVPAAV